MPEFGTHWNKVEKTEKEVDMLRRDIKETDKKTNIGIYIAIAALVVGVISILLAL